MLGITRMVGIGMNADRTRPVWKAASLLLAGVCLSTAGIAYAAASSGDDKAAQTAENVQQAEAALDPVTRALKAAVRNGSMSEEDALQTYWLLTNGRRGSGEKERKGTDLEQAAAKLDAMVTAGKLSAEDAEAKMSALKEKRAFEEELVSKMESEGKSKTEAYLEQAAAKLDQAVEAGKLSAEDAEAKMDALEKRIAFKEEMASKLEIDGKFNAEAYLELVAERLEALVKTGELSAEDAEARLIAIKNSVTVNSKAVSLDARTVLRAVKRVDLDRDQKDEIRDIEREVQRVYRKISRKNKQGHTELAEQVKAEITGLLDAEQIEQFEAVLERLDRGGRRGEREQGRQRGRQSDREPREP